MLHIVTDTGDETHQAVTGATVGSLLSFLDSPSRTTPVLVLSTRVGNELVLPISSIRAKEPHLPLYVLTDKESVDAVCNHQDEKYAVFGGAIRVIAKGNRTDVVLRPQGLRGIQISLNRLPSAIEKAWAAFPNKAPATNGSATQPDATSQRITEEVARALAQHTCPHTETVERLQRDLATVTAINEKHRKRIEVLERAAATTKAALDAVEQTDQTDPAQVFSDPEQQFRYEVEQAWLTHLPEASRDEWPLREYQLGPDFVDSITDPKFQMASNEHIVSTAVDVITRRAYDLAARAVHPQLEGEAGKQVVRARDKASAYRCTILTKPGGPRLLWWELTDGTVELARAAGHDDHKMR